jgi:phosphate transport system substrate-binding protein
MNTHHKRVWALLAIGLGAMLLVIGCGKSSTGGNTKSPSAGAAVALTGAGATFPYPLYSKWIADYASAHPGIRIDYQSIGSGGGIQQLKAGTVDFGASDAPLSDEEIKAMPHPVVHIPTVAGAVVVAYNLPGVTGLKLSGDLLSDIYLGRITNWNDTRIGALNPGLKLPNMPIAVAHRADGSGTTYIFTNYLAAVSPDWAKKVGAGKSVNWPVGLGGKGNEGVADLIRQLPGRVGYIELAYAQQIKLPYALMRNAAGKFVAATVASTTAAAAGSIAKMQKDVRVSIANAPAPEAYPIAGFTYLLVYQQLPDPAKGKALQDFITWAITDGQKDATPLLYAPLPAEVVKLNETALQKISVGATK